MRFNIFALSALTALSSGVYAHVSVVSNEASAGWYYDAMIGVPHGCKDPSSTDSKKLPNWDTYKVEVKVPKTFKKPRPYDSIFGKATVSEESDFYLLTWTRNANYPEYETDSHAYKLGFKTKLPVGDFAIHRFPAIQYCHKNGVETQTAWVDTGHGKGKKPAPKIIAYPKNRFAGWNKFTISQEISDLSVFDNAQIVWLGDSAYSKNPVTKQMITNDKTVNELTTIPAGSKIWVKY